MRLVSGDVETPGLASSSGALKLVELARMV